MKVTVNEDCIGCGLCVNVCPEVFQLDGEGRSVAVGDPDSNQIKVVDAASVCPVNAIEVQD